jgi:sugar (pentulose or hexulose) kinase
MFFAAIDLGATYIKSCRIDCASGAIRGILRENFPIFEEIAGQAGSRTVPFKQILKVVTLALKRQLDGVGGDCKGILFSNQMHGLVLMHEGEAVSQFYSWQDLRSEKSIPEVKARMRGFVFHHETGEYLRAGFPALQLFALKNEGLQKGSVCDLGNAIVQALSGDKQSRIEVTNASATGAWDIQNGKWHSSFIRELGLDAFVWPEVVDHDKPVGSWDFQGKRIPLFPSIGDQQISLLGAGLTKAEQACFNIATGSQVSRLANEAKPGEFQLRPYFEKKYLRTITHIPAGRALNRLVRLFSELNPALELEQAWEDIAAKIDGCDCLTDLPEVDLSFFPSAFGQMGSISRLDESNLTVGSLMRGALVSLVRMHLLGLERLALGHIPIHEYLGAGGILRKSKFLRSQFRKELGKDLVMPESGEDALQGHAVRVRKLIQLT